MSEQIKPENEEISSLNAEELDAEQLENVAGGAEMEQAELADGCSTFKCTVNF
jgi:hypothetical protein